MELTWTEVNDLNSARGKSPGGSGTQTAALNFWWLLKQMVQ